MFREKIKNLIKEAASALGIDVPANFAIVVPENSEHGDYATNVAMAVAKSTSAEPMETAAAIVEKLNASDGSLVAKAEAAAPGFMNMLIADTLLLEELSRAVEREQDWGKCDIGAGKTAVVEYFQLNIAKRPHIGHLRSAVIGDAIKRMLLVSGYNAVSDTHVGDWGTQFGILLLGYKDAGKPEVGGDPFDALEKIYQEENAKIEADPTRRDLAKEEFAKLERGDPENRKIWQWMVEISMQKLEESAARLGLLPFDEHMGESAYETAMPEIVELALEKGVAKKTEDGAVVVDLSSEGLDEAVLVKSDGASTYLLRDLATIRRRKEKWNFWKNIYVVDVRQSHHFKQVFRVAALLGFDCPPAGGDESEHVEFGFVTLPEGAMSTRKGTSISLDAVFDEAIKRARAIINEKNPELHDAEAVAEMVGVGALKYFDLSHHRKSDIVFRWDEALSFDGNTGPYLQYTHARLRSILRKAGGTSKEMTPQGALDPVEHRLLVSALRFPEVIEDALADFTPNILANYLYNLARLANEFYHSHPVIQEPDEAKRALRIALVAIVALTLSQGFCLLGVGAPEEM